MSKIALIQILSGDLLPIPITESCTATQLKKDIQHHFPEFNQYHLILFTLEQKLQDELIFPITDQIYLLQDNHYCLPPHHTVLELIKQEYPYVPDRIYQRKLDYSATSFIEKIGLIVDETYIFTIKNKTIPYFYEHVPDDIVYQLQEPHGRISNSCQDIFINDFNHNSLQIKGTVVRINFMAQIINQYHIYKPSLVLKDYTVYLENIVQPHSEPSHYLVFPLGLITNREESS